MGTTVQEHNNNLVQFFAVLIGVLHGLTFNQWISLGVLVTSFISMMITLHYKKKNYELAHQELALKRLNSQHNEEGNP